LEGGVKAFKYSNHLKQAAKLWKSGRINNPFQYFFLIVEKPKNANLHEVVSSTLHSRTKEFLSIKEVSCAEQFIWTMAFALAFEELQFAVGYKFLN